MCDRPAFGSLFLFKTINEAKVKGIGQLHLQTKWHPTKAGLLALDGPGMSWRKSKRVVVNTYQYFGIVGDRTLSNPLRPKRDVC